MVILNEVRVTGFIKMSTLQLTWSRIFTSFPDALPTHHLNALVRIKFVLKTVDFRSPMR